MRTLFLQAPSYDGFDGGAGARYQAKREIRSFWYPTWLSQPAALVPDSKLVDAPPHRLSFADISPYAQQYELLVLHTSSPSFLSDVKTAEAMKARNPDLKIGFIGAKVAVEPKESLEASRAIDFVARNEFDYTIKEVAEGRDFAKIAGLSYRNADGVIVHNADRAILEDMDTLPFVTPVYKRRPHHRELFHRLSAAPLHFLLYGTRLQIALHLLPVAADGRRPSLPYAERRPRDRGIALGQGGLPAGEGVLLRRRYADRQSAARRGARQGDRQARVDLVLQRQGQRPLRDIEGDEGQRLAPAPRRL